ncbi:unnamed protein product [Auanema sp. JU1783]|nr:unnamed protein product [Auanema sp. JU1783]
MNLMKYFLVLMLTIMCTISQARLLVYSFEAPMIRLLEEYRQLKDSERPIVIPRWKSEYNPNKRVNEDQLKEMLRKTWIG